MDPVMLSTVLALLCAACTLAVPIQTYANSVKTKFVNEPIRVSAFNIKTFGQAKMSNEQLANIITKLLDHGRVFLPQSFSNKGDPTDCVSLGMDERHLSLVVVEFGNDRNLFDTVDHLITDRNIITDLDQEQAT
ncbi:hypothetical protein CHS0354_008939 [Potamilus streckersoni]|uniref:Uncharacterized protein n=1 Tax=Potamilus streckersoni TaxID=2493646 RepID=A0AAE0THV4_9BIVA|nr:hypothetical protein CHS0354_008939 [Potamilus streckersoni]